MQYDMILFNVIKHNAINLYVLDCDIWYENEVFIKTTAKKRNRWNTIITRDKIHRPNNNQNDNSFV